MPAKAHRARLHRVIRQRRRIGEVARRAVVIQRPARAHPQIHGRQREHQRLRIGQRRRATRTHVIAAHLAQRQRELAHRQHHQPIEHVQRRRPRHRQRHAVGQLGVEHRQGQPVCHREARPVERRHHRHPVGMRGLVHQHIHIPGVEL
ncbi:hypothetical protein D3C83_14880 [compost metagenome]